ncbi:unnamed protein product [Ixodes hexagonus]
MTLNVRGLRSKRKQRQLLRLLNYEHVDVAAVQETKLSSDEDIAEALEPFRADFEVCVSHAVGLSAGCFLFLRKSLGYPFVSLSVDQEVRLISCDLSLRQSEWRFICAYAHNTVNARSFFFKFLANFLDTDKMVVLMGDFNCVCNAEDRALLQTRYDRTASILKDLLQEHNLVDVACRKDMSLRFTHFQGVSHARLDRIYVSGEVFTSMARYNVRPIFFSIHCMVSVRFGDKAPRLFRPKWELWKFNVSLLKDEKFSKRVLTILHKCIDNQNMHIFAIWDSFKQEVKNLAIERSTTVSYENKQKRRELYKTLILFHELECINPGFYSDDINVTRAQLQALETEKYRGAVVRSRTKKIFAW